MGGRGGLWFLSDHCRHNNEWYNNCIAYSVMQGKKWPTNCSIKETEKYREDGGGGGGGARLLTHIFLCSTPCDSKSKGPTIDLTFNFNGI